MKKIVLLTDFSEASAHAFTYVSSLYSTEFCEFTILHCYSPPPDTLYHIIKEEAYQKAQARMEAFMHPLLNSSRHLMHTYDVRVLPGPVVAMVELVCELEHFDLVVLGTSGAGISPVVGSVATALIRKLSNHVLTVPLPAPQRPLREIVIATDYSESGSLNVYKQVTELAHKLRARITCLTIRVPGQSPVPFEVNRIGEYDSYFQGEQVRHCFISEQNIAAGILKYLDKYPSDLLVMISHHKALLDILLGRSLTRRLVCEAQVPVLALSGDTHSSEYKAQQARHFYTY